MKDIEMSNGELTSASEDIEHIREALDVAEQYGLQLEIVWSAIQYAKSNPEDSVEEAMNHALGEWDAV